ncbi:MAG: thiol-disulfide isomerase/thioredoxin [Psychroserpens sp.]|jgi:thiol-disulfide isomerase/thioredoxin|uniref:TlpA family protein disulfide reductase n=1 Tax=Psychroserpens sp. TaxID=2020870 RepID=UPI0039E60A42
MKILRKKYFLTIVLSIIIFICLALLPAFISKVSHKIFIGVLFCIYFLIPILSFKKSDTKKVRLFKILIITIPGIIIYLIFPIFNWSPKLFPLGISVLLAGIFGYFLPNKNVLLKLLISVILVALGYHYFPKYSSEISYRQNFINVTLNQNLKFHEDNLNLLETSNSKLVILEFWNSACAQCIKDFPKFQKFYNENKNKYEIYSVNIPWKRDKENNFNAKKFIDSLNFDFPVLSMEYEEAKKLEVMYFPTALIIDRKNIKYNGRLIYESKGKNDMLKIIKKIINE